MPSSGGISQYLAEHYMVKDAKPKRKNKDKKKKSAQGGIIIADEDDGWGKSGAAEDEMDVDGPVTVTGESSEFRRTKKSNWKTLGDPKPGDTPKPKTNTDAESAAADAILASAAAETAAAREADDEMPTIDESSVVKMSDGTHAGLQSAATVSAQLRKRKRAEEDEFAKMRKNGQEEETVYRDATGRRVDISMKRAEARREAAEAEEREKERQVKIAPKGDVQAAEAKARREALEDAKTMAFARTADDEQMNQELKEQDRWNDPMAQFMSGDQSGGATKGKKGKKKPVYTGGAPPNRYGIKPGYRWDGVDRSNGFEAERFKAINRRDRNKGLEYSWQMDE